jgi:hypothetical protein
MSILDSLTGRRHEKKNVEEDKAELEAEVTSSSALLYCLRTRAEAPLSAQYIA